MNKTSRLITGFVSLALIVAAIVILASRSATRPSSLNGNAASLALVSPVSGTFDAGNAQKVLWTSMNYVPAIVQVALIRKVSDNPARYELVRMIAPATLNDGSATWVPAPTDIGTGLSLEIGCALSSQACTASAASPQLAVVNDGKFANTANVFQAIEAADNK